MGHKARRVGGKWLKGPGTGQENAGMQSEVTYLDPIARAGSIQGFGRDLMHCANVNSSDGAAVTY